MARSLLSSQRAFPLVVVLTLAASLLPARALGWTRLLAEIISIPIIPFADPLNQLATRLRPPPHIDGDGDFTIDNVNRLKNQASEYERLYRAETVRVDSLERQLSQLQGFAATDPKTRLIPVVANIALRSPSASFGPVTLNRGSNHHVVVGAVAVYEQVHLMGRVTEVTAMQSMLLPLTNVNTQVIGAVVIPKDRTTDAISLPALPSLALEPKGDGTFVAGPDHSTLINIGDEVVLLDASWPASAQGMKIGIVESVSSDETRPLRNIVIVKPAFQVSQISMVLLRIESQSP